MKKALLNGTLLLAISGVIAKLLGAIYRIPLTNVLGAEGIGLYQLVFPIYALVITLCSGAIPIIVSRLVAEENVLCGGNGNYAIFKASFKLLLILGGLGTLLTAALCVPFALMQGQKSIYVGYLVVAPSVFFAAAAAGFKGLFMGSCDMRPTAFAQFFEQLIKMAFGLSVAVALAKYSQRAAVWGALFAITVSEAAALLTYYICYRKFKNRMIIYPVDKRGQRDMGKLIIKLALPIIAAEIILPLSAFADSVIIVNILKGSTATAQYGIWTGPVSSLINLPAVLSLALSAAVVPAVSKHRVLRDADAAKTKSTISLKLAFAIGLPSAAALLIMAQPCISLLYPSFNAAEKSLAILLLRIGAINCLLVAVLQVYNSLLQALDKSKFPVYSLMGGVALKIVLELVLIPVAGISGAAIASVSGFAFSVILDAVYYHYLLGANIKLLKSVGKITLSGVIMSTTVWAAVTFLSGDFVKIISAFAAGVAVYAAAVLVMGVFTKEELAGIPLARLLVRKKRH